ncbi:osteopontin [Danio aesculapii]|uniref:osteopontin n=1 Tax=Danio aesculapii TaxID=1142201 RepID=UPI0024BFF359|nr:osteopontin [Danio aesculapii]
MKSIIVLTLLVATVFCVPVKRSASSSESSEELVIVQRPPSILRKSAANVIQVEPTQTTPTESNESTDSADDTEEADEESETDEKEEDNETDSSESESGETDTTIIPVTVDPTLGPIINTGRGDSLGNPSDYKKSIVYVDAKDFEKLPSPYKSYSSDKLGGLTFVSKKMSAYDDQSINDVEKEIKLYKALQVHDLEDEDTSTTEMDNMEANERQAALGAQEIIPVGDQAATEEEASAGDSPSDSASASASQEENEEESDSEETTATPGAADSESNSSQSTESQESDSDEETTQTTEASVIIVK